MQSRFSYRKGARLPNFKPKKSKFEPKKFQFLNDNVVDTLQSRDMTNSKHTRKIANAIFCLILYITTTKLLKKSYTTFRSFFIYSCLSQFVQINCGLRPKTLTYLHGDAHKYRRIRNYCCSRYKLRISFTISTNLMRVFLKTDVSF